MLSRPQTPNSRRSQNRRTRCQNTTLRSITTAQAWGDNAPRGGKAVLNRIIKDKATVPLFFGQTLIRSLRDVGYNSTTSALCEHVDNAIQWGATSIRVYFHQSGKRGAYQTNILVLDNGCGMAPNILRFAMSFGGSMVFDNRSNIGRYGMGMKTAALSMCPVVDIYSWQEHEAYYNMTLDVEELGKDRSNLVELPVPALTDLLPRDISDILTKPLSFPDRHEQLLLSTTVDNLQDRLGRSGTIVYLPGCDRLSFAKSRTPMRTRHQGNVPRLSSVPGRRHKALR